MNENVASLLEAYYTNKYTHLLATRYRTELIAILERFARNTNSKRS